MSNQITENSVHVIIKETELSIEFWVQTVKINVYLHNYTAIEFIVDDQVTTLKKVFIKVLNLLKGKGCIKTN